MAPPGAFGTAWCSRARGALDIARGALGAGGRVNSIHPRASGTNSRRRSLHSRAPRRWRHRGRSAPPGARVLVARLISPAARSERAEGSIQSTHERLEPTAGGAVSTVEHPGDGANGGVWRPRGRSAPPGARVLVARLISPAVRLERAGGSIQSTHERLEPTAGGAVSTVEHPGDGATGGARGPQVLRCSCTLASVLLATGVELSMRMCEHLELIGAAAVGKISCRHSRRLNSYYRGIVLHTVET